MYIIINFATKFDLSLSIEVIDRIIINQVEYYLRAPLYITSVHLDYFEDLNDTKLLHATI